MSDEVLHPLLARDLTTGFFSHAYLIGGFNDGETERQAMGFVRKVLCGTAGCDSCSVCRLKDIAGHPDLHLVDSDYGVIGVDDARSVSHFLRLTAVTAPLKVAWIKNAARLNAHAANALLKSLEEPPGKSVIVLSVRFPTKVPATLLSRCRIIRLAPIGTLKERRSVAPLSDQVADFLNLSLGHKLKTLESYLSKANTGEDTARQQEVFLEQLEEELRRRLLAKVLDSTEARSPFSMVQLVRSLRLLLEMRYTQSINANPRINLEHICLTLHA